MRFFGGAPSTDRPDDTTRKTTRMMLWRRPVVPQPLPPHFRSGRDLTPRHRMGTKMIRRWSFTPTQRQDPLHAGTLRPTTTPVPAPVGHSRGGPYFRPSALFPPGGHLLRGILCLSNAGWWGQEAMQTVGGNPRCTGPSPRVVVPTGTYRKAGFGWGEAQKHSTS